MFKRNHTDDNDDADDERRRNQKQYVSPRSGEFQLHNG